MTIAEQLKKKRKELDLSQEFVADKVGISRRTFSVIMSLVKEYLMLKI